MDINDGSSLKNLQAILSSNSINLYVHSQRIISFPGSFDIGMRPLVVL